MLSIRNVAKLGKCGNIALLQKLSISYNGVAWYFQCLRPLLKFLQLRQILNATGFIPSTDFCYTYKRMTVWICSFLFPLYVRRKCSGIDGVSEMMAIKDLDGFWFSTVVGTGTLRESWICMSTIKEICSLRARVTFQRFTQESLVDFRLCKYNSFQYEILRRFLQPLLEISGIKSLAALSFALS